MVRSSAARTMRSRSTWGRTTRSRASGRGPTCRPTRAARRGDVLLAQLSEDPEVLSYHFWGFLNASFVEDAWAIFAGVDMEKGFEVGSTVVLATTQKS